MGKMVKKEKITGDVVVMEDPQATFGVRTRAKTLALQQNPELCYLQLRSRRLEKPQFPPPSPKHNIRNSAGGGSHGLASKQVQSQRSGSRFRSKKDAVEDGEDDEGARFGTELDVDASFGENTFNPGRGTRESTPCTIMRDFDGYGTPGSAVRSTCSGAEYRRQSRISVQRNNPYSHEMEEFLASAELQQKQRFMDKYNFDVGNDLPLSGRYEWVRIDS